MGSSVGSSVGSSSGAGAVIAPSAVVTSNAPAAASEIITPDSVMEDAFCSTTSNVTVASVPSPSDVAPIAVAESRTLPSETLAGTANAPAGR